MSPAQLARLHAALADGFPMAALKVELSKSGDAIVVMVTKRNGSRFGLALPLDPELPAPNLDAIAEHFADQLRRRGEDY